MMFIEPFPEGNDHVQQHLVAIGDDERAGHRCNNPLAAISASGGVSMASAQAIRSGS
jgi:hypothetical protein